MNIHKNITASNVWLKINRPKHEPITMERVTKRFNKAGLLSIEADAKTTKGSANGYLTGILYLAPHSITGFNMCPAAVTCKQDCLFNAGRGAFGNVTEARIIKTLMFLHDRKRFTELLIKDIWKLVDRARRLNMKPVVRLNGTSDLLVERVFKDVMYMFSFEGVQFYDYTKQAFRFQRKLPTNYHLTFSYDGVNMDTAVDLLNAGHNVTAVFHNSLPEYYMGYEVIDGDKTDLRFLDKPGVIVGLKFKGHTKEFKDDRFIITDHLTSEEIAV